MGCRVERTDTGVEIDVHVFDDVWEAEQYVTRHRGFKPERILSDGLTLYTSDTIGEHASVRRDARSGLWRVCFWIEGSVRAVVANPVMSKLAWHGEFRTAPHEPWQQVVNGSGLAISYATKQAATEAALFETARRLRAEIGATDDNAKPTAH